MTTWKRFAVVMCGGAVVATLGVAAATLSLMSFFPTVTPWIAARFVSAVLGAPFFLPRAGAVPITLIGLVAWLICLIVAGAPA